MPSAGESGAPALIGQGGATASGGSATSSPAGGAGYGSAGDAASGVSGRDGDPPRRPPTRHGVWVYGASVWIGTQQGRDKFMQFVREFGINDVYLSTENDTLLARTELPPFLSRLYDNGVRAEALLSENSWSESDAGHERMRRKIQNVVCYNGQAAETVRCDGSNRANVAAERFRGVHLDIEPWVGTGNDLTWVEPLTETYRAASSELSGTAMTLVADVSGAKIQLATEEQRQAMLDSVTRLVLLQYEAPIDDVQRRTDTFLNGLSSIGPTRGVIVAVRAQDFPEVQAITSDIETYFADSAAYRGWAIFDYDAANPE